MSLGARVGESSGRARCLICGKIIKKNLKQIRVSGYQTEGSIHNDPKDCNKIRKETEVK